MQPKLHVTRLQIHDSQGEPLLIKIEGGDSESTAAFITREFLNQPGDQPPIVTRNSLVTGLPSTNNEEVLLVPAMNFSKPKQQELVSGRDALDPAQADNEINEDNGVESIPVMPSMNFSAPGQTKKASPAACVDPNNDVEVLTMPVMNFAKRKAA